MIKTTLTSTCLAALAGAAREGAVSVNAEAGAIDSVSIAAPARAARQVEVSVVLIIGTPPFGVVKGG